MLDLVDAWARLDHAMPLLGSESIPPWQAIGRILAADVVGRQDLPPFDNSAMDGYALHSDDVKSATDEECVRLLLRGDTFAGDQPAQPLARGTAIRIMTGAPLPKGANCVLRLEDARLRGEFIEVRAPVPSGRHVRLRGEDIRGETVLGRKGDSITPGLVGLFSSSGIAKVEVGALPRVGTLITGNELTLPGAELAQGAIFESNGALLRSLAQMRGISVASHEIVRDERDLLTERVREATHATDLLLISGGVSVGKRDYVKAVLDDLGAERIFWRVRMKPGKPLLAARMPNGCTVLGLPGNPVSALAGWVLFAAPIIDRLRGNSSPLQPAMRPAVLTDYVTGDDNRVRMLTAWSEVSSDGLMRVTPTNTQGSAMLRSMASANCFIHADIGASLDAGDVVRTYPFSSEHHE